MERRLSSESSANISRRHRRPHRRQSPFDRGNMGQSLEVWEVEVNVGTAGKLESGPGRAAQAMEGEETKVA